MSIQVDEVPFVSRAPRIHHRPHVTKSRNRALRLWWSMCPCGHIESFGSWRRAYIDAYRHSERLLG